MSFVNTNPISNPDFITEFASLPVTQIPGSPKSLDGFTIEQVNGAPGNSIMTTVANFASMPSYFTFSGTTDGKIWYPSAGDYGYTKITLTNGDDFGDMGLFVSSAGGLPYLAYQLFDNGLSVGFGLLGGGVGQFHWLSIAGGGFDTLYLRNGFNNAINFNAPSYNTLALDRILVDQPTVVPVPGAVWLMGSGLLGLLSLKRRGHAG